MKCIEPWKCLQIIFDLHVVRPVARMPCQIHHESRTIFKHLQTQNPTWKFWAKSDFKWSDRIIPESLPNHLKSFFAQGLCTQYCMSGLKQSRGAMKGDRVALITHAESSQTEKEKRTKPTEFGTQRHKNTPGDARPTRARLFRLTKHR